MYFNDKDKERILNAANGRLLDVITENTSVSRRGSSYKGKCPACGEEKKFEFTPKKNIFKCWSCGFGGNDPVSFWMKQDKTYPEALKLLADQFNIMPDIKPNAKASRATSKKSKGNKSYCAQMLAESGLTAADIQSKVFISDANKTVTVSPTFRSGTINGRNEIIDGDDVIIEYYNLKGEPVKFEQVYKGKGTGKIKEYFRVRWQFPDEHLDKNGKPFKYKSPSGSGSFLYIPERIRELFREKKPIQRLFIQEGEKKAEKACKHGIPSVAISGIHNLGRNGVLHEDLVDLIAACEVKELILLFDGDVYDLSNNIGINDFADQRPRSFFVAAKNFKEYCVQLRNSRSIYLEMYIGNVKPNAAKDKGIDDLLANTLKGDENKLLDDIEHLINERSLTGEYLKLHKITSWSDAKLMDLWSLNNASDFAMRYKKILKDLPEFRIGKYRWRFKDDGEIESAQPIEADEQYWEEIIKKDRSGDVVGKDYKFRYERCFRFLQNRGFSRFRQPSGDYSYIQIEHPFVNTIHQHEEIRDFVKAFTREIANEDVLEMLHRGGPQFLGPEKLSNLNFVSPNFENPRRDRQLFYFKENYWDISRSEIIEKNYSSITHQIWRDNVHDIAVKRTPRLIHVDHHADSYTYTLSDAGKNCHFLQFLINASNFTWRKERNPDERMKITEQELLENNAHLVSKLCAIGFMMMSAKDKAVAKVLVGMDGKQSEVGASNGRTGKSLLGNLFQEVTPTVYINGKSREIENDQFLWSEMTVKTKVAFIDDVRTNFNIEFLFGLITGNWPVNKKSEGKFTIPFDESPKLYITTNHALNGDGSSYRDRQWLIAFSDYYNDKHRPPDDFGGYFFDDWDFEQWNLTWNLLAECVQLYLRFGVVEAPGERVHQRQLRQAMGESFISWADEYFSDETKLNEKIKRKDLWDSFNDYAPEQRRYNTPHGFKSRIEKYCQWKGYLFNPHLYDPVSGLPMYFEKDGTPKTYDKSGGIEYFIIGTPDKFEAVAGRTYDNPDDLPFTENKEKEF